MRNMTGCRKNEASKNNEERRQLVIEKEDYDSVDIAEMIARRLCDESFARGWTLTKYDVSDIEPIVEDYLADGWGVNETYMKILKDLQKQPLTL